MSRRPKKQTLEIHPPRASETWYQAIFEQAADGIFISDRQGRYLEVNPRGCQMLGYSHEEMLNFSWQDLLPAQDPTNDPLHLDDLLAGKISLREHYLRCKDGRLLPVEIKAQRLADGNLLEIMRDITERKQVLEALRLTRFVIQNISHGVYWIDSHARILDVNEAACRTLGYTREELTQMSLVDIDPGFSLNSFPKAWQIQKQKGSLTLEVRHKTKDGRLLPMEVVINFIQFNGQELTCCLAQDITERKRTAKALQESETRFRNIVETTQEWIWEIDRAGRMTYNNPAIEKILGYTPDELLGNNALDHMHAEDRQQIEKRLPEFVAQKRGWSRLVVRWQHKDGTTRWLESNAAPILEASGKLVGFLGTDRDITQRKQTEEALRKSEARYRALIESQMDLISRYLPDTTLTFVNDAYCQFYGKTRQELIGHSYLSMVAPEFRERTLKNIERMVKIPAPITNEALNYRWDGKECWIQWVIQGISDENGQVVELQAIGRDITLLKQSEETLRQSEEDYRNLYENAPNGYLSVNKAGLVGRCNRYLVEMLGYNNADEIVGKPVEDLYADTPHGKRNVLQIFQNIRAGGTVRDKELQMQKRDSTPVWISLTANAESDDKGQFCWTRSMVVNITERKQAEEALWESTQRLQLAVRAANIGLWDWDIRTDQVYYSPEWKRQIGYAEDEISSDFNEWRSRTHPDDLDRVLKTVQACLEDPRFGYTTEFRFRHKDGSYHWIMSQGSLHYDGHGDPIRMLGSHIDITERKQAEQAIKEWKDRYEAVILASGHIIYDWDPSINEITYGGNFERTLGYSAAEMRGGVAHWLEIVHPDDISGFEAEFKRSLAAKDLFHLEYRVRRKDGNYIIVEDDGYPIFNAEGQLTRAVGSVVDITERKQAVEALRQSEERFAKAFRASPFGLVITRLSDGKIIEVNQSWQNIFGYSLEELAAQTSITLNIFKNPADRERAVAQIQQQGFIRDLELEINRKSGEIRLISVSAEMIEINNESCSMTILNDITERKQVERALQLQSERLKLLSEIDRAILTAKSSTEIADVVLERVRRLIPSCRASIILFDYERQEILAFAVDFDGETKMPAGKLYSLDPEILDLFPPDKVEVIQDIRELANLPKVIAQLRSEGIVSMLGVPLLMHGQLKGRLNLSSDVPHAFTAEHLEIAGQVAIQLAIALQQNQLYEQTRLQAVELEQRVAERTAQLETANKELEAFAYSVSHDLRAPLRAIDGYTRILLEDYEPSLDAEGKRVCAIVCDEAQRMGHLIDDLLTFSRFSRADLQVCPISMKTLAHSVFYELTTPEDRERLDFYIDSLPPAMGDPTSIRQVWLNLLANAIKFSSKKERAIIQVLGKQDGLENIYSVQDNGAGFDKQYIDKLFGVFQRLHDEEEFEGSGVGLAIVQRVIYRHGGRVWADSELDQGATFYFALPRNGG